ncbi:sugar O-acetyltransferase [Tropicibacter sp. Alg240-R139]|uniref:sugar O-acetyltransferase n=1 Tax=Tropicibacter sp. Alg240-R139 TaxID=2305991 RepID=UPI0013DEA171|nr:sugar O-acetyltransferase [Tropicibacter sp. Alg240-R139]
MTPLQKMLTGDWYSCLDPELEALRDRARTALFRHNHRAPDKRRDLIPELVELFQTVGEDCYIEGQFHCAYGMNISLGDRVFLNTGCTILDSATVQIGTDTMLGPTVQIYCAQHAKEPQARKDGMEFALPVTIGENVWIGGGAIIMPGVTIGDRAIVGAGSVVLKDVPDDGQVVGNPARLLP